MKTYRYTARHRGKLREGTLRARSRLLAHRQVAEHFGTVLNLQPVGFQLPWTRGRVSRQQLAIWLRQFSTMLSAGVNMRHSLEVTAQGDNEWLCSVVLDLLERVRTGHTLASSLAQHPHLFSEDFVSIVWAGEESGRLPAVLNHLATEYERVARVESSLKSQLTYPACVLVFGSLLMLGFFLGVMPALSAVFVNLGVDLPWLTRCFMAISDGLRNPYLDGAGLLLVGLAWMATRRLGVRRATAWLMRRLPGLGDLIRAIEETRWLTALSLMMQSGLKLNRALVIMRNMASTPAAVQGWEQVLQGVMRGEPLALELAKAKLFRTNVLAILSCGEESGELTRLMLWCAELLDMEIQYRLQAVVALAEPLTMLVLGIVSGVAILAAFLPLIQLISAFMTGA